MVQRWYNELRRRVLGNRKARISRPFIHSAGSEPAIPADKAAELAEALQSKHPLRTAHLINQVALCSQRLESAADFRSVRVPWEAVKPGRVVLDVLMKALAPDVQGSSSRSLPLRIQSQDQ